MCIVLRHSAPVSKSPRRRGVLPNTTPQSETPDMSPTHTELFPQVCTTQVCPSPVASSRACSSWASRSQLEQSVLLTNHGWSTLSLHASMSVSCRTPVTSTQCQGIKLHTWRDLHAYMRRLLSGSTRSRRDGEWLSWTAPQCLRQEDLNSKPDPCQCPVYVQAPKPPKSPRPSAAKT